MVELSIEYLQKLEADLCDIGLTMIKITDSQVASGVEPKEVMEGEAFLVLQKVDTVLKQLRSEVASRLVASAVQQAVEESNLTEEEVEARPKVRLH